MLLSSLGPNTINNACLILVNSFFLVDNDCFNENIADNGCLFLVVVVTEALIIEQSWYL